MSNTQQIWLVIPDLHFPFECGKYIRLLELSLEHLATLPEFRGIVQLGDFVDWFQISEYSKDPSRISTIADDLFAYGQWLGQLARKMPEGSTWHQLEGNHEDRLRRYVWQHASKIHELVPPIKDILQFPERNAAGHVKYIWHPYGKWDSCKIGNTIFHHGFYFSKHVAATCLDKYPCNFVFGHTHRVQYMSNGRRWAANLGHGAEAPKIAHTPTPNDWQQALGVYWVVRSEGQIELSEINSNSIRIAGKVITL